MKLRDPVFIIGCPRSGTTLLFTILSASPELWSSYRESHFIWQSFLPDPRDPMYSMQLTETDFQPKHREQMEALYLARTYNSQLMAKILDWMFFNRARALMQIPFGIFSKIWSTLKAIYPASYRVIDKTPPNCFRISFIKRAFPEAKFIYLTRDARTNISSLIEGWRGEGKRRANFQFRKFYDYNSRLNIKDYNGGVWCYTNPPGWEKFLDKETSIEEIAAFQWLAAHQFAQADLEKIDPTDYMQISYESLVADTPSVISKLAEFLDIPYQGALRALAERTPMVSTLSGLDPNKWLKNKTLIQNIMPSVAEMQSKLGYEACLQGIS